MITNGVVSIFTLDDSEENFVKRGSFDAWIHHKKRFRNIENGVRLCDRFDVRIAIDKAEQILPGDMMAFSDVAMEDFSVAKCRKIAVVTENLLPIPYEIIVTSAINKLCTIKAQKDFTSKTLFILLKDFLSITVFSAFSILREIAGAQSVKRFISNN